MTRSAGSEAKAGGVAILELQGLTKRFPGVLAVDDVDLAVERGEVHVVAGENGAGKSTLMKLLSQVERPDEGRVLIDGKPVAFHGPRHAQSLGVAMVYQEFALAPDLSVAENLFLGREPGRGGFLRRAEQSRQARLLLERVGLDIGPDRPAASLSVAHQQLVEIAKALGIEASVVIMDEPTATLTGQEIDELFEVIRGLTAEGIAVLYISHRLDEIFRIADRVTVMRDGRVVATSQVSELDEGKLVAQMVGREIENLYPKPDLTPGDVILRVVGVTRRGVLSDCSFEAREREILGFGGLVGAGRTELARAVFGADPIDSGKVELDGRDVTPSSPKEAIAAGIGYLSEDRKRDGLALELGIDQNITLAHLPMSAGRLDLKAERKIAELRCDQLRIRTPSVRRQVNVLSGGNQQKVVAAKWLETEARVLFFDEPARGIDVGAKAELFGLIGELAAAGHCIVLISSYLPELLNLCDRILVMRDGRVAGVLEREDFSEEGVIGLATGAGGARAA
jgi:ribose transport system ATP-binding protein